MKKQELYKSLIRDKKAVLYDFDGVLADSEFYYYTSYNTAFRRFGHTINKEKYWKYWTNLGLGIDEEIKRNNLKLTNRDIETINNERREVYIELINSGRVKFIEDSYKTIELFKKMGKSTVIASNSRDDLIKGIFKANRRKMDIALVGRKDGLRTKPYPDIFIYAAGYLRKDPSECFVIEDAYEGLKAAKSAGMTCAVIRNKYNRGMDFKEADIIFNSYREFYNLTKKL